MSTNQLDILKAQNEQLKVRTEMLQNQLKDNMVKNTAVYNEQYLNLYVNKLEADLKKCVMQLDEAQQEKWAVQTENTELKKRLKEVNSLQNQIKDANTQIQQRDAIIQEQQNQLASLRTTFNHLQAYFHDQRSLKSIMSQLDKTFEQAQKTIQLSQKISDQQLQIARLEIERRNFRRRARQEQEEKHQVMMKLQFAEKQLALYCNQERIMLKDVYDIRQMQLNYQEEVQKYINPGILAVGKTQEGQSE